LGLLLDYLSAGRTQNLNFFDLLQRKPEKALQEYSRLYRDDFLGFADSFSDLIERQFPQYSYLIGIVLYIHENYTKLDLEISSLQEGEFDFSYFETKYFSPIDTLFW